VLPPSIVGWLPVKHYSAQAPRQSVCLKLSVAKFAWCVSIAVGAEAVLQVASSGETLAEASLFSPAYHCDAIAATETVVRLYPKKVLLKKLERDPKLGRAFTARLAQQVMALRTRLEQRNILSARERIRHFLTLNLGVDGQTVEFSGTLKDLAADLGLTHEALYRTLADMEKDKEIRRVAGKIIIQKYDPNHMSDGDEVF